MVTFMDELVIFVDIAPIPNLLAETLTWILHMHRKRIEQIHAYGVTIWIRFEDPKYHYAEARSRL